MPRGLSVPHAATTVCVRRWHVLPCRKPCCSHLPNKHILSPEQVSPQMRLLRSHCLTLVFGSSEAAPCPEGSYCPDPKRKIPCPLDCVCPVGSSSPQRPFTPVGLTLVNAVGFLLVLVLIGVAYGWAERRSRELNLNSHNGIIVSLALETASQITSWGFAIELYQQQMNTPPGHTQTLSLQLFVVFVVAFVIKLGCNVAILNWVVLPSMQAQLRQFARDHLVLLRVGKVIALFNVNLFALLGSRAAGVAVLSLELDAGAMLEAARWGAGVSAGDGIIVVCIQVLHMHDLAEATFWAFFSTFVRCLLVGSAIKTACSHHHDERPQGYHAGALVSCTHRA